MAIYSAVDKSPLPKNAQILSEDNFEAEYLWKGEDLSAWLTMHCEKKLKFWKTI